MATLPQLPDDFYSSHPKLDHIRRAAHSLNNPTSPDAALGVCLARVAAIIPVGVTFPGFVGGNLNYLVGLVGPSGAGKSTAHRLGCKLVPNLGDSVRDSVPIGSGEGMVEAYLRTVAKYDDNGKKSRGESIKEQAYASAFYYVDEAEGFINRSKAEASTALATLRALWSGADVGAINARTDTSRHLKDGTYRFTAVFGFQPAYAMQLIADDRGGTPQRFVFVSALDARMPDVGPTYPGPLPVNAPSPGDIVIDAEITRLITRRRRQVMRGEITLDPLDSHRDQLQLRTAYLLAVLCGEHRAGVTVELWNRAGDVLDVSRAITDKLTEDAVQQDEATRIAGVMKQLDTREIADAESMRRRAVLLGKYAIKAGKPVPFAQLQRQLPGRDRNLITADDAVSLGYLRRVSVGDSTHYAPGPNAA